MNRIASIDCQAHLPMPYQVGRSLYALTLLVFIGLSAASTPARASDACTVLLCLAGNWRGIEQCLPPVRRVLRDLMLGRSFPICGFAPLPAMHLSPTQPGSEFAVPTSSAVPTAGTQATLRWADGTFCPVQYRSVVEDDRTSTVVCSYTAAIEVTLGGQLWNRTWWNMSGESVTEWTAAARIALPQSASDDRFDRDFQAWLDLQRANAELQQQQTPSPSGNGG